MVACGQRFAAGLDVGDATRRASRADRHAPRCRARPSTRIDAAPFGRLGDTRWPGCSGSTTSRLTRSCRRLRRPSAAAARARLRAARSRCRPRGRPSSRSPRPMRSQRTAHLQVGHDVDVARLLQADAQRGFERIVQARVAGEVAQVADHHPVALAGRPIAGGLRNSGKRVEARRRRGTPAAPPPAPAAGATAARRARPCVPTAAARSGAKADFADLVHQHRRRHALEAVAAVRPASARARRARPARPARAAPGSAPCSTPGSVRAAPAPSGARRPAWRGLRLPAAWRRRATRLSVLLQVISSPTWMPTRAVSAAPSSTAELAQRLLVAQGEVDRLDRALEDRQQAVGLVDQPAAGELEQVADLQVQALQAPARRARRRSARRRRWNRPGPRAAPPAARGVTVLPSGSPGRGCRRGIHVLGRGEVVSATRKDRHAGQWVGT